MAVPGFRHLGLKLLSIALASLIWLLVSGERTVERALRIPLEFTNLPAALELVGDTPDLVDVRVRGSSPSLSRVAVGEMVAVLNVQGARPGRRLFHLTGADVRVPFGLEVVQITPSNVPVTFEKAAIKTVPVVPELDGEPDAGFLVGTIAADPATVEVIGPASAVANLREAMTEPVSVTGTSNTVTETVTVGVADPSVRLRAPVSAKVTVGIVPQPVEWAVAGIRIKNDTAAQIAPAEVTAYVRGPRDARGARAEDFEASIDAEGLQAGLFQLPVRVTPPARLGVVRVDPPTVRVRIR